MTTFRSKMRILWPDLTLSYSISKSQKRQYIALTRAILEKARWLQVHRLNCQEMGNTWGCGSMRPPFGCFIKGFLFNPLFTICGSFILFQCCLSFCLTIFILNHLLKLATSFYSHGRLSWFHCYKIIRVSDKIGLR